MKRKICVVTGSRAEYGLLQGLMMEIKQDAELELITVATGMHMSPEFGLTYKDIENDGFYIHEKIEMLLSSDSTIGIAKSIGLGVIGFSEAYSRLKPDLVVLLGDRFEILAAAQAAMVSAIPIAHLHGGESTEGAIDEAIRHAVTKMAHLHFVAAERYRSRVIQLGEHPRSVFNFGALGVDNIHRLGLLSRTELEQSLEFELGELNFLVTYHPATLGQQSSSQAMEQLLKALDRFPQAKIIFTKPNADTDGRIISSMIDEYCSHRPERAKAFVSLGQVRYLSALRHTDVVIGNSSSGIIEAPLFRKPTVNIGNRQLGRLKAASIIDCCGNDLDIYEAIRVSLSEQFQQTLPFVESLYGDGHAAKKIKEVIKSVDLTDILNKSFYNIEHGSTFTV